MQPNQTQIITFIAIFAGIITCSAQKDYTIENYYLNEHIIFPASTGINYYPVVALSYRKQWTNIPFSPQTIIVSSNFRIGQFDFYTHKMMLNKSRFQNKERIGIGLCFKQDKNGPLSNTNFNLSYAYHMPFNWATASLGMDMSYNEIAINYSDLFTLDPNDPDLFSSEPNNRFIQSSVGIQVSNEVFFATLAVRNLLKNNKLIESGFIRSKPDYYLYAGYTQNIKPVFTLEPSVLISMCDEMDVQWNSNIKLTYKSYNWISLSYYSSGIIQTNIIYNIIETFQVGYGCEIYLNNLSRGSYSGHRIYIGRNLGLRNLHGIRKNIKQKFL